MSRIERGEDEQRIAGARTGSDDGVDRSPRVANRAAFTKPAEISGYEIVTHYFAGAADRLGLARRPPGGAAVRALNRPGQPIGLPPLR